MHGRRQLVPQGVHLSVITSETPILNCKYVRDDTRTLRRPPALSWRKEGSTAGQYAPNFPGNTRATKDRTMSCDLESGS